MSRKVLTIRAGETKILPKGSTIISTATTGIVATSNCADIQAQLINAESYSRYAIAITSAIPTDSETFPTARIYFSGVNVGGKNYYFSNTIAYVGTPDHYTTSKNALQTALQAIIAEILKIGDLAGLFINTCVNTFSIDEDRGIGAYLAFNSLPSLVEDGGISLIAKYAGIEENVYLYSYVTYLAQPVSVFANAAATPCTG